MSQREHIVKQLGARRIEFISTAVICVVFAVSFAHLEYYYIKDPALQISNGRVEVNDANFDRSRETKPIIGNMYQYHLFPMLFIFVLISFAALWDDRCACAAAGSRCGAAAASRASRAVRGAARRA